MSQRKTLLSAVLASALTVTVSPVTATPGNAPGHDAAHRVGQELSQRLERQATRRLLRQARRARGAEAQWAAVAAIAAYEQARLEEAVLTVAGDGNADPVTSPNAPVSSGILAEIVLSESDPALRSTALQLLPELAQEADFELHAQALAGTDPEATTQVLALLETFTQTQLAETLSVVLYDPDPDLRGLALQTARDTEVALPVALVHQLALSDPQPVLRQAALTLAVTEAPAEAQTLLDLALTDPDPEVSELARELLAEMAGR